VSQEFDAAEASRRGVEMRRARATFKKALRLGQHRLVEVFLVTTLDYTWDEVHAEAERLEHAISDELAARMDHFLSYPRFDPHGDPIPDAHGQLPQREIIPLDQAPALVELRIDRVTDQDPELLRYLKRLGLVPMATCTILEVVSYDGQVSLAVASQEVTCCDEELHNAAVAPAHSVARVRVELQHQHVGLRVVRRTPLVLALREVRVPA